MFASKILLLVNKYINIKFYLHVLRKYVANLCKVGPTNLKCPFSIVSTKNLVTVQWAIYKQYFFYKLPHFVVFYFSVISDYH